MRVLAEFVDHRNGKRYFPGDGDKIDPALTDEQVERLRNAGCLKDGDESGASAQGERGSKPVLDAMTVAELKLFAGYNAIDLGEASKKPDLIARIEAGLSAKDLRLGPTVGEWVAAGYPVAAYPPGGYALRSSREEIDAAIAAGQSAST